MAWLYSFAQRLTQLTLLQLIGYHTICVCILCVTLAFSYLTFKNTCIFGINRLHYFLFAEIAMGQAFVNSIITTEKFAFLRLIVAVALVIQCILSVTGYLLCRFSEFSSEWAVFVILYGSQAPLLFFVVYQVRLLR